MNEGDSSTEKDTTSGPAAKSSTEKDTTADPAAKSRRASRTYAEAGIPARRRSLAYADLMAVFYPPSTLRQPTVTDTPFECREWEGVDDAALSHIPIDEPGVASWEPTLERAIKSIVSIKAQCVRSFDTETSGTYTATGFVVDATEGLILSNRHVVSPAPVVAQAIFVNYEEVELQPVYRDPVHDFGFFRFDPGKLRFMQADAIRLAPHKAKVGMEIRVVGNDAGEKLSILAGTLARLDRAAPEYGVGQYNDFNTFYLQAASGTSGGSSGSPVLDIYGDAVALNAGGAAKAASSFYLPLSRVVRALDLVRRGAPVPRGTVQAEFEHRPYDELRRLGLDPALEREVRAAFPESQGMLSVRTAQRGGPADGSLQSGDIVVAVNGAPTVDFVAVEDALDSAIGGAVRVSVWRGARAFTARIAVQDMRDVTPSRFVEIGGGVVNEVSYQVARGYGVRAGGVYVASSGHVLGSAGAWRGSVIVSVNNVATPSLDAFAAALALLVEGSRVPLRLFALDAPYRERVVIMNVTTHWHALRMATRDERTGYWLYRDLAPPAVRARAVEPQTASVPRLPPALAPAHRVWPSLVYLDFHIPYLVDGMRATQFAGPGFIVDRDHGYIACDRDTVPTGVGDVYITIAGSVVLPGRVELLHPAYNFAIVKYDPLLIGSTPVENTPFHPEYYAGARRLAQGDAVYLVGVSADQSPVVRRTEVSSRSMVSTRECVPPRFRCVNIEGVKLHDQPSCQGGVLCDAEGLVMALWVGVSSQDSNNKDVSTMSGLDVAVLRPTITSLHNNQVPDIRSLDTILWTMRLAPARTLGLSAQRIRQIEENSSDNPRLFYVTGLATSESPAAKLLATGDIILEKNGRLVQDVNDISVVYGEKCVELVVLRDGKEITLNVPTTPLDAMETRRVVHWLGALIQQPYRAVHEQIRHLPSEIYVSCTLYGSPANCYGLRPGMWITEVENHPVKTIDDFVNVLKEMQQQQQQQLPKEEKGKEEGEEEEERGEDDSLREPISLADMRTARYVRITVVNKTEVTRVLSLRVDGHFWPTWQLVRDPSTFTGWTSLRHL